MGFREPRCTPVEFGQQGHSAVCGEHRLSSEAVVKILLASLGKHQFAEYRGIDIFPEAALLGNRQPDGERELRNRLICRGFGIGHLRGFNRTRRRLG